jgi:flagellar hook-associated protein 1 FlgK
MATINSAFGLISSALQADQAALNIVANNAANVNTPGYTREAPTWQESKPVEINGVGYGTGVIESGPVSLRDRVLEQRLAQQQQTASATGARLGALESLQALFPPDSGASSGATAGDIGSDITSFFDAFSALEASPTDNALRLQVLSTATMLAGDISNASVSLQAQKSSLDEEAAPVTDQVNALTAAIAQLNKEIESSAPKRDAGVLEDQRQLDLSKLSQLIGFNQVTTDNNGISIATVSGDLLVSEGSSFALTTGKVGGETHFFVGTTDVTAQLTSGGGELGGLLVARDQDIPEVMSALDQLAYGISTSVNAANNSGTNLNGVTGSVSAPLYIFNEPAAIAGSAASMRAIMTDPRQLAAAGGGQGTGDNSNAGALAALANQGIIDGETPSNFYSDFVTKLGSKVAKAQIDSTAQNASLTQVQTQRDSLSAVNLNDEAAMMQQIERSYQAASKVFNILNTIMTSVLNLGIQSTVS